MVAIDGWDTRKRKHTEAVSTVVELCWINMKCSFVTFLKGGGVKKNSAAFNQRHRPTLNGLIVHIIAYWHELQHKNLRLLSALTAALNY